MLQQISQKTFGKNINEHLISGGHTLRDTVTVIIILLEMRYITLLLPRSNLLVSRYPHHWSLHILNLYSCFVFSSLKLPSTILFTVHCWASLQRAPPYLKATSG